MQQDKKRKKEYSNAMTERFDGSRPYGGRTEYSEQTLEDRLDECALITDVIDELFKNSNRIHRNVMFEIVKGLFEIDIDDLNDRFDSDDKRMEYFSETIMSVVIEKMEILYYFYEDDIFSMLVYNLCSLLNLNLEDYGFSRAA